MPTSAASKTRPATPAKKPAPPTSTLVLLVRHGTTPSTGKVLPGRASGLHLSEKGEKEAATVAARLADWAKAVSPPGSSNGKRSKPRVAAVYASPLERTQETAAPIASLLGLPTRTEPGLLRVRFRKLDGSPVEAADEEARVGDGAALPERLPVSGGRVIHLHAGADRRHNRRVSRQRHRGETIVAVSHADPIKAAVAEALGSHLDLFQRIVISPCSVTAIAYGPLGPTVLAVNRRPT